LSGSFYQPPGKDLAAVRVADAPDDRHCEKITPSEISKRFSAYILRKSGISSGRAAHLRQGDHKS
jgi:hypothetical protein